MLVRNLSRRKGSWGEVPLGMLGFTRFKNTGVDPGFRVSRVCPGSPRSPGVFELVKPEPGISGGTPGLRELVNRWSTADRVRAMSRSRPKRPYLLYRMRAAALSRVSTPASAVFRLVPPNPPMDWDGRSVQTAQMHREHALLDQVALAIVLHGFAHPWIREGALQT